MAEHWIIRVHGKEYGPADLDTLREWKNEGRLLPENEARSVDLEPPVASPKETPWTTAAQIPGVFDLRTINSVAEGAVERQPSIQSHGLDDILINTFRIYREGFIQFASLALLTIVPSLCTHLADAGLQTANVNANVRTLAVGTFGFCMMLLTLLLWPIYLASIQILTAEHAAGRRTALAAAFNQAVKFWPRVASLCIFVYGVFFLLTVFGFGIAAVLAIGASSLFVVLLALGLLVLQIWMFGRFFINVLFWQQFAVLENAGVLESLRESQNLARSRRDLPWFQRPLWRGVFISSMWFAFVLAITLGPEWPALHHYFHELTITPDPQGLLQKLTENQQDHGLHAANLALSVVQRILQPLLGIAFVLLYFDSKSACSKAGSRSPEEFELRIRR